MVEGTEGAMGTVGTEVGWDVFVAPNRLLAGWAPNRLVAGLGLDATFGVETVV